MKMRVSKTDNMWNWKTARITWRGRPVKPKNSAMLQCKNKKKRKNE